MEINTTLDNMYGYAYRYHDEKFKVEVRYILSILYPKPRMMNIFGYGRIITTYEEKPTIIQHILFTKRELNT